MRTSDASVLRGRLSGQARVRQIEVFVAVADLGGVHLAAQRLGISQPGVTKHVQDLERLLEAPLFLRHAKGMRLTTAGEQLLPSARMVLANLDEVAERTAALNGGGRSMVRVVASRGAVASLLAKAIPAFGQADPGVLVVVREADPLELATLLAQETADLAVCRALDQTPRGWSFTPVMDDQMLVVAGPRHPLAARRHPLTVEALANEIWLSWPLESRARAAFDQLFKGHPTPASWPVMTRSPVMLWTMLRAKPVLALLPASYLHEFLECGQLVRIPSHIDLPLAPIGVLQPERATAAATRLGSFLAGWRDRQLPRIA